ncbi:MAG: energy transducer TonB, partial [Acidobacteriota bacterium]
AFQRTLDVIAVVPDPAAAGLTDLRELASGFLQLAAATAAANPAPASRPPAAARPPAAITESAPAAESGGAAAPPGESAAVSDEPFSGPVAIRQDMPGWQPPDAMARRQEYHGVVHLMIDATGRVEDVRVIKASHPSYDAAVVRAARQWAFTPASRGGRPVASEKDIEVFLRPQ